MEFHERLKQAREYAGDNTAKDAAEAFGWNEVTYRSHEAGDRGIRKPVAEKYARAFQVTFKWLYLGEGASDQDSAEIVALWRRIPRGSRGAARQMLEGLASDSEKES